MDRVSRDFLIMSREDFLKKYAPEAIDKPLDEVIKVSKADMYRKMLLIRRINHEA